MTPLEILTVLRLLTLGIEEAGPLIKALRSIYTGEGITKEEIDAAKAITQKVLKSLHSQAETE